MRRQASAMRGDELERIGEEDGFRTTRKLPHDRGAYGLTTKIVYCLPNHLLIGEPLGFASQTHHRCRAGDQTSDTGALESFVTYWPSHKLTGATHPRAAGSPLNNG